MRILFLGFLILLPCQRTKKSRYSPISLEGRTYSEIGEEQNERASSKVNLILKGIKDAPNLVFNNRFVEPFNTFKFDKVIAFDFDGEEEMTPSVIDKNGQFVDQITQQKALSTKQVEKFIDLVTDPDSYGSTTAACFDPGWAIVFFMDDSIQFVVDICLECNYLRASQTIPASQIHKEQLDKGIYYNKVGFSKKVGKLIRLFAKDIE